MMENKAVEENILLEQTNMAANAEVSDYIIGVQKQRWHTLIGY